MIFDLKPLCQKLIFFVHMWPSLWHTICCVKHHTNYCSNQHQIATTSTMLFFWIPFGFEKPLRLFTYWLFLHSHPIGSYQLHPVCNMPRAPSFTILLLLDTRITSAWFQCNFVPPPPIYTLHTNPQVRQSVYHQHLVQTLAACSNINRRLLLARDPHEFSSHLLQIHHLLKDMPHQMLRQLRRCELLCIFPTTVFSNHPNPAQLPSSKCFLCLKFGILLVRFFNSRFTSAAILQHLGEWNILWQYNDSIVDSLAVAMLFSCNNSSFWCFACCCSDNVDELLWYELYHPKQLFCFFLRPCLSPREPTDLTTEWHSASSSSSFCLMNRWSSWSLHLPSPLHSLPSSLHRDKRDAQRIKSIATKPWTKILPQSSRWSKRSIFVLQDTFVVSLLFQMQQSILLQLHDCRFFAICMIFVWSYNRATISVVVVAFNESLVVVACRCSRRCIRCRRHFIEINVLLKWSNPLFVVIA